MEQAESALAYARADFSEPNGRLCAELGARFELPSGARVLDLGCGPADIPLRLARARGDLLIDAVDGSEAMLLHAREAVDAAGMGARVQLHRGLIPGLPLIEQSYDSVISNSLLHHLHDPAVLWREIRRLARPGAALCVMDLFRPQSAQDVSALVQLHAADAPAVLRRDFEASLYAAFRPAEVRQQLAEAALSHLRVDVLTDRHMLISGEL